MAAAYPDQATAVAAPTQISDAGFAQVRDLAMRLAGIVIAPSKKALVVGRWGRRVAHYGFRSFDEYLALLDRDGDERQMALDLLTTNETSFFREPKHFEFLRKDIIPAVKRGDRFRVWSAASSSGEEAYSVAMLLAAELAQSPWEVLGTDVSTRVLATARGGLYDLARAESIPRDYLVRFCLKGHGPRSGSFMIERSIRERVRFEAANLIEPMPDFGLFDVILLRNVLIYFDAPTKERVLENLLPALKSGGYFIIGHCDALAGVRHPLRMQSASIYRKP